MHYTLDQCKEVARILLQQENPPLLKVDLDYELPWPTDAAVLDSMSTFGRSKKQAATALGITRKCLKRRIGEMKEFESSARLNEPVTVRKILLLLTQDKNFQQISDETEVHQMLLCRLLTSLVVAVLHPSEKTSKENGRFRRISSSFITNNNNGTIITHTPIATNATNVGSTVALWTCDNSTTAVVTFDITSFTNQYTIA